jgi:phage host-nuclease inhibitor protein Gam
MKARPNGRNLTIESAVALLIRNEAAFVKEFGDINRRHNQLLLETKQTFAAIERRFASIEHEIDGIKAALRQVHQEILQLPEAVRQKIGFKAK